MASTQCAQTVRTKGDSDKEEAESEPSFQLVSLIKSLPMVVTTSRHMVMLCYAMLYYIDR